MNHSKTFFALQRPRFSEKYEVYGNPHWDKFFEHADWTDDVQLESVYCPVYPGHQRPGKRFTNLSVELPSRNVGDFVWTWGSDCLITDKLLHLFHAAELTGFSVNPVAVKSKTQGNETLTEPPVLWELVVTGKGGDAAPESGIRLIYTCPHCNLIRYSSFRNGIIVDEQAWDGSDFFTVTGYPRFILVTERVKELVIRNDLTNCALVPSQDLRWKSVTRPEDHYGQER